MAGKSELRNVLAIMACVCVLPSPQGITTPFLISRRNEWSVLIEDIPYYMHTSYETILLQCFQEMRHYYILRTIKT